LCITLCPQLATLKITAKQTQWSMFGWYVSCTCFHQNRKGKTKQVPFHVRHRTKLTPLTDSRRKWMFSWLLLVSLLSHVYRLTGTQAHYPWQKIPLLYKIKLLILTFILIQFAE
jgi:hypothetical protein